MRISRRRQESKTSKDEFEDDVSTVLTLYRTADTAVAEDAIRALFGVDAHYGHEFHRFCFDFGTANFMAVDGARRIRHLRNLGWVFSPPGETPVRTHQGRSAPYTLSGKDLDSVVGTLRSKGLGTLADRAVAGMESDETQEAWAFSLDIWGPAAGYGSPYSRAQHCVKKLITFREAGWAIVPPWKPFDSVHP